MRVDLPPTRVLRGASAVDTELAGGILVWTRSGNVWSQLGAVSGLPTGIRALTGRAEGSNYVLYSITAEVRLRLLRVDVTGSTLVRGAGVRHVAGQHGLPRDHPGADLRSLAGCELGRERVQAMITPTFVNRDTLQPRPRAFLSTTNFRVNILGTVPTSGGKSEVVAYKKSRKYTDRMSDSPNQDSAANSPSQVSNSSMTIAAIIA